MWKSYFFLYTAYSAHSITDRVWKFVMIFTLHEFGGIEVIGFSQMFQCGAGVLLSPIVGRQLGRMSRRAGVLSVVCVNNLSVVIAASFLTLCAEVPRDHHNFNMFLGSAIFFAAISKVAADGEHLAIAKDWIVVMTRNEGKAETLAARNVSLTVIAQCSAIFAPIFGGFLVTYLGIWRSCVLCVCWSTTVLALKSGLLLQIYSRISLLSETRSSKAECEDSMTFREYVNHAAFPAVFGLAMLSLTVFDIDALVIGYAQSRGMPPHVIGTFGSISAGFSLFGSLMYTAIERCMQAKYVGFGGITFYCIAVSVCLLSIFLPGGAFSFIQSTISIYALLSGICFDRIGFVIAHLAVTQVMQETIPDSERSVVFGMQHSLRQFFTVVRNLIFVLAPNTFSAFSAFITVSFSLSVFTNICFGYFIYKDKRMDKVHLPSQSSKISVFHDHVS